MLFKASYLLQVAAAATLLSQSMGSPVSYPRDTDTTTADSATPSLLTNEGYLSAWASATGHDFSTVSATGSTTDTLASRTIGKYNGRTQYVAYFWSPKKGRWIISMVLVSNVAAGLADSFTSTHEVASAFAQNARYVMGVQTGYWASTSWGFYTSIAYGQGFTIVTKALMPRTLTSSDRNTALQVAKALARAYGLNSDDIAWMYPKNAKRSGFESPGTSFSVIADFTPTVQLADYLLENFHGIELGLVSNTTRNDVGEPLRRLEADNNTDTEAVSKRVDCRDYNERERIKWDWVPWNTAYDIGCVGSLSDFYPED